MQKLSKVQRGILEYLKRNGQARSSVLADFLGVDKTTIQRNIKKLLDYKFVESSGAGRSVKYAISETNKVSLPIDVEEYFAMPYLERDVKERFNFDIFALLENDLFTADEVEKITQLQQEFVRNISKYKSQTIINKEFERIMIEFSWKSSAIEGNTYTLLATEALLKDNVAGAGKTKEETHMILNHKDAFNEAIQNKERFKKLDYKDIEYLHRTLTKDLRITANIRNAAVGVTGTKYKPLDNAMQIKEALQKMTELINKKELFFEKAFLAVLLISYIQPFEDGNKRTARMISNAVLLAHGSIPLSYRIVDVEEYKKAVILFYEQNNISYFKQIFIEQFTDAVKNYFN